MLQKRLRRSSSSPPSPSTPILPIVTVARNESLAEIKMDIDDLRTMVQKTLSPMKEDVENDILATLQNTIKQTLAPMQEIFADGNLQNTLKNVIAPLGKSVVLLDREHQNTRRGASCAMERIQEAMMTLEQHQK